jgi:hypothetical protein
MDQPHQDGCAQEEQEQCNLGLMGHRYLSPAFSVMYQWRDTLFEPCNTLTVLLEYLADFAQLSHDIVQALVLAVDGDPHATEQR